ncbi:type I methionyl aminopeptidase [Mucilaginibacter myungsuensis]|uniref:Methionine aminopeptidase n=1 Tax=Mucilaginibacter myungsuensis TaxID=649104 RepID=A0A929PXR0_9SPHI|nr:type I methionyl aminopeptidase [Mucilaginibacter myungsuensis]MBE9663426.1 type I methionyl aminopeptidase [Mucilaginibacter myungsuensis]MDN3600162.1 type I methionyl aminopeptidase [Mucilaginibacter myungsuensis]
MSINSEEERIGIEKVSEAVAKTLKAMCDKCAAGMSAKELDDFGGELLKSFGAVSAPYLTYEFPGHSCISVNNEVAHGIPSAEKIFQNGDLINIDVSAELNGFWADNGCSFVLGEDTNGHTKLVEASKEILKNTIAQIKGGVKIADIGKYIETQASKRGFTVIKNLAGHGVGRSLHEPPHEILNCYDRENKERFRKNSVVAIETFISTKSTYAREGSDEWGLIGDKGGYVAQHEHTIIVTDGAPIILTKDNGVWG